MDWIIKTVLNHGTVAQEDLLTKYGMSPSTMHRDWDAALAALRAMDVPAVVRHITLMQREE